MTDRRYGGFLVLTVTCLSMLASAPAGLAADRWYTYEDCKLIDNRYNDADSFHVRTKSDHFIFRLYFVDACETSRQIPDRVSEQAAYFGIDEERALALGLEACAFTKSFLADGFKVQSKRDDARGMSDQPRFFGLVGVGDKDLGEELVRRGLARVYGAPTDLPDGTSSRDVWSRMRTLERAAREQGVGGWSKGAPAPSVTARTAGSATALRSVGKEIVLPHTVAVYDPDNRQHRIALLPRGTRVRIMREETAFLVRIEFEINEVPREGLCQKSAIRRLL